MGKKGEFIFLLLWKKEREDAHEILRRKFDDIFEKVDKDEKKLLKRIFVIQSYEGRYPENAISKLGDKDDIVDKLDSLEKKGHISRAKFIETYHPALCKEFIKIGKKEFPVELVIQYLEEYLENIDKKREYFGDLFGIGTNIVIEKDMHLIPEAVKFLKEATNIKGIKKEEKVMALNNLGIAFADWAGLIKKDNPEEAKQKYNEALKCFDKALEIDPKDAKVWNNKGEALRRWKKYEEAIECYDKALEINEKYAKAWNNKGLALGNLGKYDEALKYYDKALEIDKNLAEAWYNKGLALGKLGRYKEAIECFDKALEIDSNLAEAWIGKGIALSDLARLIEKEKPEEAKQKYEEAIKAIGNAAFLFYIEGRIENAYRHFAEVYYMEIDLPIRYECGVAYGAILCLGNELYDAVVGECWKHKDEISSSARVVLEYLVGGKKGEIKEVKNEKDMVFKDLMEKLKVQK